MAIAELDQLARSADIQIGNHAAGISRRAAPSQLSTEATTIKIGSKTARIALWNRLNGLFGNHGSKVVRNLYDVEKERLGANPQTEDTYQPKFSREDQVRMWHNAGMPSPKAK